MYFLWWTVVLLFILEFGDVTKATKADFYKINELSTKKPQLSSLKMKTELNYMSSSNPFHLNCTDDYDCEITDPNLLCYQKFCQCRQAYVYIYTTTQKCFKFAYLMEKCLYSYQCSSAMSNTLCKDGKCVCNYGYKYNGLKCVIKTSTHSKDSEIYTAALVAVSCVMVAVACILVGCVVKKSSQLRNYQRRASRNGQDNDIFTIADEIAATRAMDKPPTYDEVMRNGDRQYGIPPPDYPSSPASTSANSGPAPGYSHLYPITEDAAQVDSVNIETTVSTMQLPSSSPHQSNSPRTSPKNNAPNGSISTIDSSYTNVQEAQGCNHTSEEVQNNSGDENTQHRCYTNLAFSSNA